MPTVLRAEAFLVALVALVALAVLLAGCGTGEEQSAAGDTCADVIGVDITPASMLVWDAAVEQAYGGERKIAWMEIYSGEKAVEVYGDNTWLPNETLDAVTEYIVAIKGPLTTPVGGGIRSLNVALRQILDPGL